MKYQVGGVLCALILAGCQHRDDPAPAPAPVPVPIPTLLGEKWTLQTEEQEVTPLDGRLAYVQVLPPRTEPLTLTYLDEQRVALDVLLPSGASHYHQESTYSYQGQELTFTRLYNRAAKTATPRTMRVTALSAHRLVLVESWQSQDTHYFITQTFSR